jgi:hypothetical protein
LPIVQRANEHHDKDGDHDGDALDPFHPCAAGFLTGRVVPVKGLVQPQRERDGCCDAEED